MAQPAPEFKYPDDFAPMKGRYYYCKLCTPSNRARGQSMTKEAALRHEAENSKHLANAQAAHPVTISAWDDEWQYQPNCDWGPTPVPEGSSAWEQSYPCDRVKDFVSWWLEGVAAVHRGERPETMDVFIDRFNQKYQDWVDEWNEGAEACADDGKAGEEQAEREEWDGVPGEWYTGGSFLPHEEGGGGDQLPLVRADEGLYENAQKYWGDVDDEDPYVVWGIPKDEVTPWTQAPAPASGAQQASDITPHDPPSNSGTSPKAGPHAHGKRPRRRRHGRGRGHSKNQGVIVDGTTGRRPDAFRKQQVKI